MRRSAFCNTFAKLAFLLVFLGFRLNHYQGAGARLSQPEAESRAAPRRRKGLCFHDCCFNPILAVVVATTNHPQLLNPAIWRRFPYKIELGVPEVEVREDLWRYFLSGNDPTSPIPPLLAKISEGLSGADIQNIALAARRHSVLDGNPIDAGSIAWAAIAAAAGRLASPERGGVPSDRKKPLAISLVRDMGASKADAARLLGVTRQAVSGYLKEVDHVDV